MQPVFASYEAVLPPALRRYAAMARGLHERVEELRGPAPGELLPPPPPSWWRRDLTLLGRYFDHGGARLVASRFASRARRILTGTSSPPEL
jgi:hypothetical protein